MAIIPIWPGSSSFGAGATPFSFYDEDTDFQVDAPLVAGWCATRLGQPLVDGELHSVNFFTCFEEAINEYGAQLYNFQIINNFKTLEGNTTGSDITPYNNKLITPNMGGVINVSNQYGNETDGGGGDCSFNFTNTFYATNGYSGARSSNAFHTLDSEDNTAYVKTITYNSSNAAEDASRTQVIVHGDLA